MRSLVVDLDAVAALREATGSGEPRLVAVAVAAELAGADAIRVSANEALRPLREIDLHDLRRVSRQLELRLAPTPSLLKLALEVRPDRVILASEPSGTRGESVPLDSAALRGALPQASRALREAGIPAWARIGLEPESVKLARGAEIAGVELSTLGIIDLPEAERFGALEQLGDAARIAAKLRLAVGACGGLDANGVARVREAAPALDRIVVGRALAARSVFTGMERAIAELRHALG